jgi:hypothetical protein
MIWVDWKDLWEVFLSCSPRRRSFGAAFFAPLCPLREILFNKVLNVEVSDTKNDDSSKWVSKKAN